MENRIKERLTGALILVAVLVILVPELLSGHRESGKGADVPAARPATEGPPLRSYTMDLGASADSATAGQSALNVRPVESEGATLPAPAPVAPPVEVPALPQTTAPAEALPQNPPQAEPRPIPKPEPQAKAVVQSLATPAAEQDAAVPAKDKGWFVQVGSFAKRENAQRYVQQLAARGFSARMSGGGDGQLFRVRVGPAADKAAAAALQARLAAQGFKGSLAAP